MRNSGIYGLLKRLTTVGEVMVGQVRGMDVWSDGYIAVFDNNKTPRAKAVKPMPPQVAGVLERMLDASAEATMEGTLEIIDVWSETMCTLRNTATGKLVATYSAYVWYAREKLNAYTFRLVPYNKQLVVQACDGNKVVAFIAARDDVIETRRQEVQRMAEYYNVAKEGE